MSFAQSKAFVETRSMRARRPRREPSNIAPIPGAAIQIFISRVDAFLGTELFGTDTPITVGRHRDAALRLDDDTVSRVHCTFRLEGSRVLIEDTDSANGTLVNRRPINGATELTPKDAVQIGAYTLKVRPLIPRALSVRPNSSISEKTTRLKAILSADGAQGTEETPIDLGNGVDWKLYEAAVRRATGNEVPRTPLVVVPGGRLDESETEAIVDPLDDERTRRDSQAIEAVAQIAALPKAGLKLDPRIDQRIDELDQMMRRIERPDDARAPEGTVEMRARRPRDLMDEHDDVFEAVDPTPTPSEIQLPNDLVKMGSDSLARYLANELCRSVAPSTVAAEPIRSKTPRPLDRDMSVVPAEVMPDPSEDTTLAEETQPPKLPEPVVTMARTPSVARPPRPPRSRAGAPKSDRPGVPPPRSERSRVVSRARPAPQAPLRRPTAAKTPHRVEKPVFDPPMIRARRIPQGSKISVPPALLVNAAIRGEDTPIEPPPLPELRSVQPRGMTALPQAPMATAPVPVIRRVTRAMTDARRASSTVPTAEPPRPPPLPKAAVTPNVETPFGDILSIPRSPIPAHLVTPTEMRVRVSPPPLPKAAPKATPPTPPPPPALNDDSDWSTMDSQDMLASNPSGLISDDSDYTEALEDIIPPPEPFAGVEIVARGAGKLLDISRLRADGDQYVLGHRTPQGGRAPHIAHTGLRLVRITDDRRVDLVFPGDAAGHLVRDGETVMFSELSQGRKYSCVRLTPSDVATVILRNGDDQIAYHIRFHQASSRR